MLASCSDTNLSSGIAAPQSSGQSGQQQLISTDDGSLTDTPVSGVSNDELPVTVAGPEGDSELRVDARRFSLDSALGDIWGVENAHYNVDFTLTNGNFIITPAMVNGQVHDLLTPTAASAVFHAELYSPGDSFSFVTYSHSTFGAGDGVLAGNAFFDKAFVGYDLDNNGEVGDSEKLEVIGGTVEFAGELPNISLHFSVTLANGLLAQGHYTGLFDFTQR